MRRGWLLLAGFGSALGVFAREAGEKAGVDPGDPWLMWKWVNFLILAAGLGYLIAKSAGAFFRSRTEGIQKGIAESAAIKRDAEARAAEIERKVAGLGQEIERMRTDARTEFAAEGSRIEQETEQMIRRLQQQSEQEITSLSKNARQELKAYAARLSLELAEQQLRTGVTPEIDRRLVHSFVLDLDQPGDGADHQA